MAEEHIQPSGQPIVPPPSEAVAPGPPPAVPSTRPATTPPGEKKKAPPEPKDSAREVVETVVFVVVLVLLLKTFLAEAFVSPTGSMANTLLGYHKGVTCEQCKYKFLVNLSGQVDPEIPPARDVTGGWCPNCHYFNRFPQFAPEPPDREDRP
jgi:hypothetical protein